MNQGLSENLNYSILLYVKEVEKQNQRLKQLATVRNSIFA